MRAKWASLCLCTWAFVAVVVLGYSPSGDIGVVSYKGIYYSVSEGLYWAVVSARAAFAIGLLFTVATLIGSMVATDKKLPWNYRTIEHRDVRATEANLWKFLAMVFPLLALITIALIWYDPNGVTKHHPRIPDYKQQDALQTDPE